MSSLAKKSMNFMRDVYALANEHTNGALPSTSSSKPSSNYRPSSSLSSQFSHHLNYDRPSNRPSTSYSPRLSPSPQLQPQYGQHQPVHQPHGSWSSSPDMTPSPGSWSQTPPIQGSTYQNQSPVVYPNQGPPLNYQSPPLPLPSPVISPSPYNPHVQSPGNQSHYFQPQPALSFQAYSPAPTTHQNPQIYGYPNTGPGQPGSFTALPPSPMLTPSPSSPLPAHSLPQMNQATNITAPTTWSPTPAAMELPGSYPKPPPLPRRNKIHQPPSTTSDHAQTSSHLSSGQQSLVELPTLHVSGPDATSVYYEMPADCVKPPSPSPSPSHDPESLLPMEHPKPSTQDSRHGSNHSITTLDDIHALDGKAYATDFVPNSTWK
ncbi:hypothetical protein PV10_07299 [Exophiala mesophila]|uniref:Uncharacterized protein n=1 Tax=Exophiala mesophila TaxID=212818 RepID=A0A0D1WLS6_EXOME|nr:uncharacterized protein PV10_07299 [Exophiala mesophila]KIV89945.1 hypothetical protein PV10_07299 [Exophiala mesophila]